MVRQGLVTGIVVGYVLCPVEYTSGKRHGNDSSAHNPKQESFSYRNVRSEYEDPKRPATCESRHGVATRGR